MHKYLRTFVAALVAIAALAMLTGAAAALRSLSVQRERITGTSRAVTFESERGNTICEVTLSGETTTTAVAKGSTSQIGLITSGRTTNCRGLAERAIILAEPRNAIRIRFNRTFTGTLPRITSVSTASANARFQLTLVGGLIRCLYLEENVISTFSEAGGGQEFDTAVFTRQRARLLAREFGCPPTGELSATFTFTPKLRVGLI